MTIISAGTDSTIIKSNNEDENEGNFNKNITNSGGRLEIFEIVGFYGKDKYKTSIFESYYFIIFYIIIDLSKWLILIAETTVKTMKSRTRAMMPLRKRQNI